MRNAGLEETQAGIKIARRNINNLRYEDDATLMAESEELKSLLMKVKEESEKVDLKLNIQKMRIIASSPITSIHFSSVTQLCLTFCDPMDCTTPGFPVHHQLLELPQTHVHCVSDAIQLSCPLSSPSLQSSPASGSFPVSQLFASGGQSIGASASASVLSMNIQDYFPLGLTILISFQSKGLSRVFSNSAD